MIARRSGLVVALVVAAVGVVAAALPSAAQAPTPTARVFLTSQNPWLAPGDDLVLGLRIAPGTSTPDELAVAVTVCERVSTRSEFALTLNERFGCDIRSFLPPQPVENLPVTADGTTTLQVPAGEISAVPGVYPVRVELRVRGPNGRSLDRFVSHLVAVGAPSSSPNLKLGVGLVVPVSATLTPGREAGTDAIDGFESARLAGLVSSLATHPSVPVTVRPSPITLDALVRSSRAADAVTVQALAAETRATRTFTGAAAGTGPDTTTATNTRQLLAGTYAPIDLAALTADGLESEITAQVSRADDVLAQTLQARPDHRTWVADETVGTDAVSGLTDRGVDRLVLSEPSLVPIQQGITPTHPFTLEPQLGRRLPAMAADAGLGAHFAPTDQPVLEAHRLLADLAVIYFDAPGSRTARAVAALPPRGWNGSAEFLNPVLDGLATSPIVGGVTLDQLFTVPPARGKGRNPLIRTLAPTVIATERKVPAAEIRGLRRRMEGFGSFLDRENQVAADLFDDLERALLRAESSELRARQRSDAVDDIDERIDMQLSLVRLSNTGSIRLTARTGEIPVTVISDAPYPVHVVLRLQSTKLAFPRGDERAVDLVRRNTTSTFTVDARASGSFPVAIDVLSPAGRLLVTSRKITVRSTVTSNVGLVLSLGAGLFLLVWWGHNFRHGRRAKRLMPA